MNLNYLKKRVDCETTHSASDKDNDTAGHTLTRGINISTLLLLISS
jgi:hypothetical protein